MSISSKELTRRRRVIKGWAFMDLSEKENDEMRKYLDGGPVPAGYEKLDASEKSPK